MSDASGGREPHVPVMLDEVVRMLAPEPGEPAADLTVGAGGHARAILERTGPDGRLLGMDRDPTALRAARGVLEAFGARVVLREGASETLREVLREAAFPPPAMILLDLGVSSMQLDDPARGFSFRGDGPLDMRMGARGRTARDVLGALDADALERALRELADEPFARKIARAVAARH
ncbi:MAG TPA: 16S rRNA (cytosine(1402)-N(4))-methyltransferase, partial [Planctomycetota bacterium]|nr:16S rRNA (cytosine(1402)-N(4))-methyltransferase [Planctomycetota bacterium]